MEQLPQEKLVLKSESQELLNKINNKCQLKPKLIGLVVLVKVIYLQEMMTLKQTKHSKNKTLTKNKETKFNLLKMIGT